MTTQELQAWSGIYKLLHLLYTYPLTEEKLKIIREFDMELPFQLTQSLGRMKESLSTEASLSTMAESLNVEMTSLFEGPGQTPAPPYASYYLENGQLMGEATQRARRFYLEWNVVPENEQNLLEDHIALELGFLAHLAKEAANAEEAPTEFLIASRDFLSQNLRPWLSRFYSALRSADPSPFFDGLAQFTLHVVEAHWDWLKTAIDTNEEELDPTPHLKEMGG